MVSVGCGGAAPRVCAAFSEWSDCPRTVPLLEAAIDVRAATTHDARLLQGPIRRGLSGLSSSRALVCSEEWSRARQ